MPFWGEPVVNVVLDLFFHEIAVKSGIFAVQFAVADREGFVFAEIGVLIEFDGDFLGQSRVGSQQAEEDRARQGPSESPNKIVFLSFEHHEPPE